MSEQEPFPKNMKLQDALKWTKVFYPDMDTDYAKKLMELFKLNIKKKNSALSTGYSSIYKLIFTLASNAPIMIFDEPVLGLDANHRDLFYKELLKNYTDSPKTIIISTHLIEEVSNIVEDVVIIKEGKVCTCENVNDLLSKGYSVSGKASLVDEYIKGRKLIGEDTIGPFKTAHIMGAPDKNNIPDGLEISKLDLQKLFIQLTN